MQIGPLKGVAAILGRILDTAQKVQGNKAACLRLVRRATTFILSIRDRMDGKWDSAPPGVKEAVDRFEGSEIVLHGEVPHAGGWWCGLEEATVKGRPVLIKHYNGRNARKRRKEDLAFLKSIWNARFPQLYGVSQTTSTTPFILLHNGRMQSIILVVLKLMLSQVGIQDIRAFVTPYLQQGNLLEVAAIATRVAEHLRAGLKMLASTGRWPAIYDRANIEPSVALLANLVVNNRGNVVIGGDVASETQFKNHRGPLVWLCHEVFGERYPGTLLDVHENDRTRRARGLANQIAGSILLSGTESPAQVSETLLLDFRDSDWTPVILRELRASMASWGLDDRGGLFSECSYGDVGYLVGNAESTSKKHFVCIGNLAGLLGPLHSKLLGEDEPFRHRRMEGHAFQGEFEDMVSTEVSPDVMRYAI
ncbi:hypothetical protein EWM64_g4940 [Hericium alpestre]|uniref:Uncharacterized protein n=1 Tax=Hericium alpestre TaxID=135208 RepID=A0A4Y9ZW78_9AGAM|nr:hypothetical protein EWM64_g4940 [Hericium alpestre]